MRVVVVGDLLLDRDIDGTSTRLCPDAPVPVVDVEQITVRAGGAGLVAGLLAADGHHTTLVTAVSHDDFTRDLRSCLVGVHLVATRSNAPTPVKTRVLNGGAPVVRFDQGCGPAPSPKATAAMVRAVGTAEALVVADYGRGLLSDPTIRTAIERAARRVPVVWDPHPRGVLPVPGMAAVTPNRAEALTAVDADESAEGSRAVGVAAARLRSAWKSSTVVVTLGPEGAWVHTGNAPGDGILVPAVAVEDVDTCGAGDRFTGFLATVLAGPAASGMSSAVAQAVAATTTFLRAGGVATWHPSGPSPVHQYAAQEATA
ncbi:MAG TPA: PfkB family carbohydrate kinase [Propionibacteriaceae bacterium]|nr:PfkB family carbohydrate kinase [Propionibacteriaceae bacterium]